MYYWEASKKVDGCTTAYWTSLVPHHSGPDLTWWQWLLLTRHGWQVRLRRRTKDTPK